ncbi:Endoplasmic reticulum metallopeptidase 1 [Linum perenne]
MSKRPGNSSAGSKSLNGKPPIKGRGDGAASSASDHSFQNSNGAGSGALRTARRSGSVWLIMFVALMYSSWVVYNYQYDSLPPPLTAEQAGKRGFSEVEAMKHVQALTQFGPHPVGSDALERALRYVMATAEAIKKTAHWEVDVEVELFHAKSGANRLVSGLFVGKTLVYSDLTHVVLRILPKYSSEAEDNAILVSSHIDTVFSTEGAGDCSSCVAVMLELARGISQRAHGFKNAVIFLFNTGEEEGLSGAHSFITQHPWSTTIKIAIDLEAMGIGGKSSIFQAGPNPWAIENFASAAKYPSANIIAQDLFASGIIKSATDFQVYKEVAGLSGLDFAYTDNSAVYHTKNDKLELLKRGSLQHLGENMLAFLVQVASSSDIPKAKTTTEDDNTSTETAVFFDILGSYMVVYKQRFASMIQNSVIMQSLLIWTTSLLMGGYPAVVSLGLSCLSAVLMWIFSIGFSLLVAFILPQIASSPVPYVANPWLVIGLFAAPALLGAATGQHLGYLILRAYLSNVHSKRKQQSPAIQAERVKLESERWMFKAGFIQWLAILAIGNYFKVGSSYLALFWLVPPAFSFELFDDLLLILFIILNFSDGLLEATLTPARMPRPLKLATLMIGLAAPVLVSAGVFIRMAGTVIGIVVRFDRSPGSTPEWLASAIVSAYIAAVTCLTLVYILSYVHISAAKRLIFFAMSLIFGVSLALVLSGATPSFTKDTARAVNVVHVVDTMAREGVKQDPLSYVSLSSITPGKLTREAEEIGEGFVCGRDKVVDFVTFSVKYGCVAHGDESRHGWSTSDVSELHVDTDTKGREGRITKVSFNTKASTRWSLAINSEEIEDFILKGNSEELVLLGDKSSADGWHIIQFAGGKESPRELELTLLWQKKSKQPSQKSLEEGEVRPLLKLRTDVQRVTPMAERVLSKLPEWCSQFGKSSSPYNLAFLTSLPVNF